MIAAPVAALREIRQLPANARRPGMARQFAHLAGHLRQWSPSAIGIAGSLAASSVNLQETGNRRAGPMNSLQQSPPASLLRS